MKTLTFHNDEITLIKNGLADSGNHYDTRIETMEDLLHNTVFQCEEEKTYLRQQIFVYKHKKAMLSKLFDKVTA